MSELRYQELSDFDEFNADEILQNATVEELLELPLTAGLYWASAERAQKVCLALITHENANVRANAVMGLGHIAYTKGKLDKRLIKPYILQEIRTNTEFRGSIMGSIEEINLYMGWDLAKKEIEKLKRNN